MKKSFSTSILRVFAALSLVSCMSTIRLIDKPSDVIKNSENNENKNANYVKANEWMVQAFNNAESVIQFTDKESGVIKGRYAMKMGVTSTSPYVSNTPAFTAIITIRVKDKASRIEIAPPSGMYSQLMMGTELGFTETMFTEQANDLADTFVKQMTNEDKHNDW